jgi:hypothetical protein
MEDLARTQVFVLRILPTNAPNAPNASQRLILEDTRTGERHAFDTFAALLRHFEGFGSESQRGTLLGEALQPPAQSD